MGALPSLYVRELHELSAADAAQFGGKSAGLGELLRAGISVPPGFAISAHATGEMGDALRVEINRRYAALGDEVPVAVRSSALGEDSAEATFAGQQDSYLWVRGADGVCSAVARCWASLHGAQAVSYRERFGVHDPAMGVAIQLMVDAAIAGVMFTCNPVTGDPSMVAINASWGLGLAVVGGDVTPDDYLVSKITGEIVRQTIGDKAIEHVPAEHGTTQRDVEEERRRAPCLTEPGELIALGRRIEAHFGAPQDIEWAIARDGTLFTLQSRPVTGLPQRAKAEASASAMDLVMKTFGAR